jgi:Holliday junction resolvase RusA-like endonuclease
MLTFTVHGHPKGKGRARFVSTPRGGRAFTPAETVAYERMIAWLAKQAGAQPVEGPLRMRLAIYMQIPQSATKKRRAEMLAGVDMPTKKPDLSNVLKAVEDGLNGIAYKDDAQIVSLIVDKFWSDEPRVEIEISPVMAATASSAGSPQNRVASAA